jgi:hypothetical protein
VVFGAVWFGLFCAVSPRRDQPPVLRSGDGVGMFAGLFAGPATLRFVVWIVPLPAFASDPDSLPRNGTFVFAT